MTNISKFRDIHKGETMLIVGNGVNLDKTPPEWFDYPSIGVNEIHMYDGWKPTYYTAVDRKNMIEYGDKIAEEYKDIPKLIPTPRLSMWKGDNFYYFKNFQGNLWPKNKKDLWQEDFISQPLIYANITHVAIKLAYFMGATTILIIGMQHRPHAEDRHWWGINLNMSADQYTGDWFKGYKILSDELEKRNIKLLNISQDTYVPDDVTPQDNWENWITKE